MRKELFHLAPFFALVEIPDDKLIDWDKQPSQVFLEATGKRGGSAESFGVCSDQIHGSLIYDYHVIPTGAIFEIYRLPGATNEEVDALKLKLKRERDVIGVIKVVKLEVRAKFECPMIERKKSAR